VKRNDAPPYMVDATTAVRVCKPVTVKVASARHRSATEEYYRPGTPDCGCSESEESSESGQTMPVVNQGEEQHQVESSYQGESRAVRVYPGKGYQIGIEFAQDAHTNHVYVRKMLDGFPATKAGIITVGDVVACIDGQHIETVEDAVRLTTKEAGTDFLLEISHNLGPVRLQNKPAASGGLLRSLSFRKRNKSTASVRACGADSPDLENSRSNTVKMPSSDDMFAVRVYPGKGYQIGIEFAQDAETGHVYVRKMLDGFPATKAGMISVGDVVAYIDKKYIETVDDAVRLTRKEAGTDFLLEISHNLGPVVETKSVASGRLFRSLSFRKKRNKTAAAAQRGLWDDDDDE